MPQQHEHDCCAPSFSNQHPDRRAPGASETGAATTTAGDDAPAAGRHPILQAVVPAQTFAMGNEQSDARAGDGEGPVHEVELDRFSIDTTSVTNVAFRRFAEETGYRTEAETFGFSAVFYLALEADRADVMGEADGTPWWLGVRGADWAHPNGPKSSLAGLEDHPVVHVSWNDAQAYCRWAGRRLPTEAEWECASRGGLEQLRYPWGDELGETWLCNIWQGVFPRTNTGEDGWYTTAPVRTYEPNAYGLWQTVGNVWEWCSDWWSPTYYQTAPRHAPHGPAFGDARVLRGGSYLCHNSYCNRYRNAARSSNTPDSSMGNAGFRTVAV